MNSFGYRCRERLRKKIPPKCPITVNFYVDLLLIANCEILF